MKNIYCIRNKIHFMKYIFLFGVFLIGFENAKSQETKPNISAKDSTIQKPTAIIEEDDYVKIFTRAEKEPKFPGGAKTWAKYLERNINIKAIKKDKVKQGVYNVKVRFIVDKEGYVSDVIAVEKPKDCPLCVTEAVKLIKNGPKWDPAVQNGRNVVFMGYQTITFSVE